MQHRIVYNEQTHNYRVEAHGFFGWNFVTDPNTGDYLDFQSMESARAWIKQHAKAGDEDSRWKVVSVCN